MIHTHATLKANVDITTAQHKADPFPFYAALREEAPVYRAKLGGRGPVWVISRYDDVLATLKNDRLLKDPRNTRLEGEKAKEPWMPGVLRALQNNNMLDLDDPDHARLKRIVHKAFTPRIIEQMRQVTEDLANSMLDLHAAQGQMDLLRDFALPFPVTVIGRMLGIPQSDMMKFHHWTDSIMRATTSLKQVMVLPKIIAMGRYMKHILRERRENPTDDLLTALVQAEDAGDQLNEDELLAMAFLLIVAGHETTVNLIANGTLALLQNPDQFALMRDAVEGGDAALIRTGIEELLRYASPLESATERYASEDMTLHGVTVKRGEMVLAGILSANRDESQFENADILDLTRQNNHHLSFGQGNHYCLGAPLARMEAGIAFSTLLRRMPDLRLAAPAETLRWRPVMVVRSLEALPVNF